MNRDAVVIYNNALLITRHRYHDMPLKYPVNEVCNGIEGGFTMHRYPRLHILRNCSFKREKKNLVIISVIFFSDEALNGWGWQVIN